jgi:hypothetical protein
MKALGIIGFSVFLIAFASCKKVVQPTLIITVVDSVGAPLENARVFTHPCLDGVSCSDPDRVNINFAKSGLTNTVGQITFEYPYSAIIDVAAQWTGCDTPTTYCMSAGQTVARFETKKLKKGETNEYNVEVIVYDL